MRRPTFNLPDFTLSIATGVLLSLSFPPFNFNLLSWIAFIPLLFFLGRTSTRSAFVFSYFSGIVFFLISLYWLTKVTILGWIILCLYLSLYPAIFGLLSCLFLRSTKTTAHKFYVLLILPCIWVSLEFLRAHLLSGFGWNSLGYAQFNNLNLIQIADFSGVYGVSFLILLINCILWNLFEMLKRRDSLKRIVFLLSVIILIFTGVFSYARLRLEQNSYDGGKRLRVSVIQPNIAQFLKWAPQAEDYIMETLFDLTTQAAADKPDMVIWPESAMPVYLKEGSSAYERIFKLAKDLNIYLLSGVIRYEEDKFYNSAILISPRGKVEATYDKLHLVPYGEFIPFRKLTPFLASVVGIGDFSPGRTYSIFKLDKEGFEAINFAVLICFEDAFPDLSRQFIRRGAAILINITNDAWFDERSEPEQHLSQSVFRAIENRVNVLRCANTGISGLIDSSGEVKRYVNKESGKDTFSSGFATFNLSAKQNRETFYGRYGDLFVYLCIAGVLFISLRKK